MPSGEDYQAACTDKKSRFTIISGVILGLCSISSLDMEVSNIAQAEKICNSTYYKQMLVGWKFQYTLKKTSFYITALVFKNILFWNVTKGDKSSKNRFSLYEIIIQILDSFV